MVKLCTTGDGLEYDFNAILWFNNLSCTYINFEIQNLIILNIVIPNSSSVQLSSFST